MSPPLQNSEELWIVFNNAGYVHAVFLTEDEAKAKVRAMKYSFSYKKYVSEGKLQR